MNPNQPYIPNHEKWIKYYESIGMSEHPEYFHSAEPSKRQTGGSIGKIGEQTILPIDKPTQKCPNKTPELKVELVSPAQQVVEQAASELKREGSIKRKQSFARHHSSTSKRRKRSFRKIKDDGNQI